MFVDVPENTVILDEMTLRHMVQDCTAVKTQLLKLKRLLHQVSTSRTFLALIVIDKWIPFPFFVHKISWVSSTQEIRFL
jgi:hypothetical protein